MTARSRFGARSVVLLFLPVSCVVSSRACDTPVFRYAMERWPAEPYRLVVFHQGPLSPEDSARVSALRQWQEGERVVANLCVETCDLGGSVAPALLEAWTAEAAPRLPWLLLSFPSSCPLGKAWSGPLTDENVGRLADSPGRREVVRRLLGGESAVCVLLESGDTAADSQVEARIGKDLARIEEESTATPAAETGAEVAPEDGLRSPMPLQTRFSVLRVSRQQAQEAVLVETLRLISPPSQRSGPLVIPVFGQGRALVAVSPEDLERDGLLEALAFLCGPCSCQAKELNPGVDLLFAADWEAFLEGRAPRESPVPNLAAVGPALAAAAEPAAGPAPVTPTPASPPASLLALAMLALGVLAVAGAVVGTVVIVRGARRREDGP